MQSSVTVHKLLATMWQQGYHNRLQSLTIAPADNLAGRFQAELYRRDLTARFNAEIVERYRQASPDPPKPASEHKAGWKTVGGGASVFINEEGILTAGCPGLKGEDVDDIENESDDSRDEREQRQKVAESKGIEGHEVSPQQAKQLDEQKPALFDERRIRAELATHEASSYDGRKAKIVQHPEGLGYAVEIERDGEKRILAGKYPQVSWQDAQGFAISALRGDETPTSAQPVNQTAQNRPEGAIHGQLSKQDKPSAPAQSHFQRAVADAATDYGLDPRDLADAAKAVYEEKARQLADREAAKEGVRKLTGLNQRDIGRMENAGFDLASAPGDVPGIIKDKTKTSGKMSVGGRTGQKLRQFDVWAIEAARQYPDLELGDPDDPGSDLAANLWDILREGKQAIPPIWHPDIINDAANMATMAKSDVDAGQFAEAFSRRGRVKRVERYAKMFRQELETRRVMARYQRTATSGIYLPPPSLLQYARIKPASGNQGTFDPENSDIRYQAGAV